MTIYDQDYMSEQAVQQEYQPGVKDSAAENQEAAPQVAEAPLEETNQSVEAEQAEQVSDKEYNFKALREELVQERVHREKLERDLEYLRDNHQRVQRQPEPPRERAMDRIKEDDLVTGAQFKQAMAEREAEYQIMLGELQVKSQHSDYDEVTAKYGVPLIEKEPDLAQGFLSAPNKAAYLYKIGHMARQEAELHRLLAEQKQGVQQTQAPQASRDAQRIVENSKKPGTLSNAVGGSGQLSKTDYIASMSDAEFYAYVQKNLQEV